MGTGDEQHGPIGVDRHMPEGTESEERTAGVAANGHFPGQRKRSGGGVPGQHEQPELVQKVKVAPVGGQRQIHRTDDARNHRAVIAGDAGDGLHVSERRWRVGFDQDETIFRRLDAVQVSSIAIAHGWEIAASSAARAS